MVSNIEKTNLKDMIDKIDVLKVQRIQGANNNDITIKSSCDQFAPQV